jgi:hypothetical protein
VSQRTGLAPSDSVVIVHDVQREIPDRELSPPVDLDGRPPQWSPDGRRFLLRGASRTNQVGLFITDAESGDILHAIPWSAPRDQQSYGWACWASDGRAVLFEQAGRGIVRHELDTDDEALLYAYARDASIERIRRFGVTADGRLIVTEHKRDGSSVLVVIDGLRTREVARSEPPESLMFQGYAGNADALFYTTFILGQRHSDELWRIPVAGGIPERLSVPPLGGTHINPVAISPSGTAVAFTDGSPAFELWIMQHFLEGRSSRESR